MALLSRASTFPVCSTRVGLLPTRLRRSAASGSTLPYRIRSPLGVPCTHELSLARTLCYQLMGSRSNRGGTAKLQLKNAILGDGAAQGPAGGLGDGEALETDAATPDYLSLTLQSRVYEHIAETPLQHAPALSERLGVAVHIKVCYTRRSNPTIHRAAKKAQAIRAHDQ